MSATALILQNAKAGSLGKEMDCYGTYESFLNTVKKQLKTLSNTCSLEKNTSSHSTIVFFPILFIQLYYIPL
jgi:hypothetical protein